MRELVRLVYCGKVPPLRGKLIHPMARYRLKKQAMKAFGVLPPKLCATRKAIVRVIRVLGPKQRDMDIENFATQVSGLVDALKPSYIVDDRPKWADIRWEQDATRRHEGPKIEVVVRYAEG